MKIDLTLPQALVHASECKYTAAVAGFGSGKTDIALIKTFTNLFANPGMDQAYLAPTYPLIRDIWYPKVDKFLTNMEISYNINRGDHVVSVQGLGKIICRTMDNPSMIVGWEVADAVLDEFDILPTEKALDVFRRTSARLRLKYGNKRKNQILITTTPEGFKATHKLFKKDPLEGSALIQMSTYSNEHNLPDDYISDLLAQYPESLVRAYLMGEFVNLTAGSVYYAFDRDRNASTYVAKPREVLHVGADFNVNDMCAVVHVIRDGKVHAVDEFFGLRDTPDLCDTLKEAYPDRKILVYPDASGKGTSSKSASLSDLKILKTAGFTVKAKSKNPLIKDRVATVNKRLEDGSYFVNIARCPEFTDCLEQQPYDKRTGQPLKNGYFDNRVDGAGYFVHYRFPIAGQIARARTLGGF